MSSAEASLDHSVAPVREFILKIAARCNLNCDYCYEYQHGDESWRSAGKFMLPAVYEEAARKIAHHARQHGLEAVSISLHGGEPLLLGPNRLSRLAGTVRSIVESAGVALSLGIQTNGVLLSEEFAKVIREHDIFVGISLDGNKSANDFHRLDHRGKSSYDRVIAGLRTLQQFAPTHAAGVLAVVDARSDPIETLDALAALGLPNVDLLLPHHNWDRPPVDGVSSDAAPYGRWLAKIWDAWLGGRHSHLRIRFLDNIVARLVGHPGLYEQMTTSPVQLVTISTDGDFEGVDTLKSTGSGVQRTGLNVLRHEIDDVLSHPIYLMRQDWQATLPTACSHCRIKEICTGGYLPHRYSSRTGFNNRSVYCNDILHVVGHIERSVKDTVGATP